MIEPCSATDKSLTLEYLERRYGLASELLADFEFYASANGRIILGPKLIEPCLSPDTAGLLIARIGNTVKPSTNLLQVFGALISRNFVALVRENAVRYIKGLDLEVSAAEIGDTTEGYVLLKYLAFPLGCGLLQGTHIKNMLPKAKRVDIRFL
jgi:NOL1/NOP2/fmu family ribosome biogenesis protein